MLHVDLRTSQECVWRTPSRILLTGSHTDGRAADARFRFEANVLRTAPYCSLRLKVDPRGPASYSAPSPTRRARLRRARFPTTSASPGAAPSAAGPRTRFNRVAVNPRPGDRAPDAEQSEARFVMSMRFSFD
ncbi:hypothetical protein KGM_203632 [Danaus plexippus plexippus]|uniref:Uncharacterized protein n=1 Tax=Danaus plexippus plexippus TaxID=278856 RepID=A0A212EPM1_DANPL|nr:hypothetical protein KGM_203632 [Danaus plexippus plexippus]